jgi:hypothetical protein
MEDMEVRIAGNGIEVPPGAVELPRVSLESQSAWDHKLVHTSHLVERASP